MYGPRGDLQLIVESAQVAGQGGLFEQFMMLKADLQAQGCFDPARKRPLPALPQSIGVVTSLDAAALRDVASTLRRRVPHLPVWVFAAPVQGEAAPAALCAALDAAYAHHRATGGCDVLLLVRGGGALEDLWAFNSPLLVRKILQAPMPVVCGVGHETDFTLADFAADLRAPTPTAAAELCAPTRDAQTQALQAHAVRLQQGVWRWLEQQAQRQDRLAMRLGRPSERLHREQQGLLGLSHRMQQALHRRIDRDAERLQRWPVDFQRALQYDLQRRQTRLAHMEDRLKLLDPQLVLQRGYALLTDAQGHAVTSARAVQPGAALRATLSDGQLDLTVKHARV